MNYLPRLLILAILSVTLTACSTLKNSETFRNRTFDYERQSVENLPTLKTPPNLSTPNFSPRLSIPTGQNSYPPDHQPDMTPPGFYDKAPLPDLPKKFNLLTDSNS